MQTLKDNEPWQSFVLPVSIPDPSPRAREILIVGAGIAGIASALSLAHELTPHEPNLQITLFERHDVLSTSGGAINLTPVAQRHLDRLGVLDELNRLGSDGGADVDAIELFSSRSGRSLGSIDFTDSNGQGVNGYKGRRVMRIVLSLAMLAVVERHPNIRIVYGKKLTHVTESHHSDDNNDDDNNNENRQTILHFQDNSSAAGDLVLGCDGVYSALRLQYVDPDSPAEYTGLSFLQTTVEAPAAPPPPPPPTATRTPTPPAFKTINGYLASTRDSISSRDTHLSRDTHTSGSTTSSSAASSTSTSSERHVTKARPPFHTSGLAISRHGDLLASYCDRDHTQLFLAAIVQIEESLISRYRIDPSAQIDPRDRIAIHRALRNEIRSRFAGAGHPWIKEVANLQTNWMLYPVHQVKPGGRWWRGNVLLLGDAAHAMPPRDESAAYALDDAIMFSRLLAHHREEATEKVFERYEAARRATVEEAFRAAGRMWLKHRDMGLLEGRWKEWTMPWMLWRAKGDRAAAWKFDAYDV